MKLINRSIIEQLVRCDDESLQIRYDMELRGLVWYVLDTDDTVTPTIVIQGVSFFGIRNKVLDK